MSKFVICYRLFSGIGVWVSFVICCRPSSGGRVWVSPLSVEVDPGKGEGRVSVIFVICCRLSSGGRVPESFLICCLRSCGAGYRYVLSTVVVDPAGIRYG